MPKKSKIIPLDFETSVMAKVRSNEISMKPRWFFVFGSLSIVIGLIGLSIAATFLVNLTIFLFRQHGPMGQWRLQQMLESFPIWVPIVAGAGIILGVILLKKYDFSYKKNFWFVAAGFIISIVLAAIVLDRFGLNDMWTKTPMRRFYQPSQNQDNTFPRGQGQGSVQGKGWRQKQ